MSNVAAEALLLSCFATYPQTFFDVADWLDEDDFEHPGHAMIFMTMKSLYMDREADGVSKLKLIAEAKNLGFENFSGMTKGYVIVDEILKHAVQPVDAPRYFKDVKRQSIMRQYDRVFAEKQAYLRDTTDPITTVIGNIERDIFSVPDCIDEGQHGFIEIALEAEKVITELSNSPGQMGLEVGMPVWQNRVGQIRNAGITFIVATAKTGKSQFGFSRAIYVAHKLRLPVLLLDSELSKNDQIVRLVGMMARVPYQVLETGYWRLSRDELKAIGIPDSELKDYDEYRRRMTDKTFWEKVAALPITYVSIAGLPMEEVIPRIRRWLMTRVKPNRDAKYPECLIVYDYIKLATMDELKGGRVAEYQVHGMNVATLHTEICQRYNVPVIAFGQTNRELDNDIGCVAGAKRIVDNVTSVTLLKRKSEEEMGFDACGNHLLRVLVARFGQGTPVGHININFDKSMGEIHELGYSPVNFEALKAERLQEWKSKRRKKRDDDDDD
jgi:hypothetical protein